MGKTILVITTTAPVPVTGACEQDRFTGLTIFKKLGYNVHVIAHYWEYQNLQEIKQKFDEIGVSYTLIPYIASSIKLLQGISCRKLLSLDYYDGAVLQYAQKTYLQTVVKTIKTYSPDVLWAEYTNTWPVLQLKEARKIPSIVRSINNEAQHYLEETTPNLFSKLRYKIKVRSEKNSARLPNVILSITPKEKLWYESLGAKYVNTLPLRGLQHCFYQKEITTSAPLKAICMLSNFNILHNKKAFLYVATKIMPLIREQLPNTYKVYVTGKKFPKDLEPYLAEDLIHTGFVPDIKELLQQMDIAVVPSIAGQGMQQKIFEPLCSSLPVITHQVSGYDFVPHEHVLIANTPQEFVNSMAKLVHTETRKQIAEQAYKKAHELFSKEPIEAIIQNAIQVASQNIEEQP